MHVKDVDEVQVWRDVGKVGLYSEDGGEGIVPFSQGTLEVGYCTNHFI